ncbi:hypothetical protein CLOSYM_01275 [[Clostridium] symbiosum ATCC 14940]|uniref:Uncharacterized protein n=1 Tax=[Clostridium] symbiosum ATCC 14940 TaxID=411472 RepID=A0ABC9U0V8_CLOSY|nr:hypothetical protein CLOSYM_01275 [[Clostridium] symbiosum ATCC 14940]
MLYKHFLKTSAHLLSLPFLTNLLYLHISQGTMLRIRAFPGS